MYSYKYVFLFLILLTACTENEKINSTKACNPNAKYLSDINLYAIDNIEEAKACSEKLNKPILTIYSTLQHSTDWVRKMFKGNKDESEIVYESYILVILNVDDRIELEKPVISQINNQPTATIGELNSEREVVRYNMAIQPLFAITNCKDEDVVNFETYRSLNDKSFLGFLQKGLKAFNENKSIQKKKIVKPQPIIRVKEIKNRDLFEEFKFTKMNYDTAFAHITNDTLKVTNVFFSIGYCDRKFNPSYTYNKKIIQINSNEIFDGEIEVIGQDTIRTRVSCELATLMEFEYTLSLSGLEKPSQIFFNEKEIQINK